MTSKIEMSLDEIIARDGNGNRSNGSSGRFRGNRNRREYNSTDDLAFTRAEDVPAGRWDHSGYEEMYGTVPALRPLSEDDFFHFRRVDLARKVRLHITNLAPTVTTTDLSELLEEYNITSVNVNYDEDGESVGTADVVADRITAQEIAANFDGVAFDGSVMHFHMISDRRRTGAGAAPALRVKDRLSFGMGSQGVKKKNKSPKKSTGKKRRGFNNINPRLHMTDAELDRELDEYMKRGRGKKEDVEEKMED